MIRRLFLAVVLVSLVVTGVFGLAADSQLRAGQGVSSDQDPGGLVRIGEREWPPGVLVAAGGGEKRGRDPAGQGNKKGWVNNGKASDAAPAALTTAAVPTSAVPSTNEPPPPTAAVSTTAAPSTTVTVPSTAAPSTTAAPVLPPPPPAGSGIPFGPFMYGSGYTHLWDTFNGGYIGLYANKYAVSTLQLASDKGMRVFLHMAGGSEKFKNPDGTFSMSLWKAAIDQWAGIDIAPFIADGTIAGHFLIDEPTWHGTWGRTVTAAELDEMARYSKHYWPDLPTVVRDQPTNLAAHAGGWNTPIADWTWQYLDAAWAQYHARKGPVGTYAASQAASADRQGLGLVMGMNVVDGGDGSSGISSAGAPSSAKDAWAMSADEIRIYGGALIGQASTCAFVMWRYYEPDVWSYWDHPDILSAMADLRDLAAQHAKVSCD